MAEKFNPLKAWLGVDVGKPNYYQIFGLETFESEPPAIADAADRAIRTVQKHVRGEHAQVAEKMVRDLAAIKTVLLSPEKRRAYDDQLRKQSGPGKSSPKMGGAAAAVASLPQSVEASDSPTMMLPPGALSGLPPLGHPTAAMPQALPPAAGLPPPALPPGAMPPGALPPGAGMYGAPQAAYGPPQYAPAPFGAPGFGDPAQGMYPPQAEPYGMPPTAVAPGYPPTAAEAQPGMYSYGPPPTAAAAPPMAMSADPMAAAIPQAATAAGPAFVPRTSTVRVRAANARKQQNSNVTVALAVLGVAAVVLVVVIVIANKKSGDNELEQAAVVPQQLPPPAAPAASAPAAAPLVTPPVGPSGFASNSNGPSRMEQLQRMPAEMVPENGTPKPMANDGAASTTAPAEEKSGFELRGVTVEPVAMEAALPDDAARAKSVPTMLSAARASMRTRDYAKAEEVILLAQITGDSPALVESALAHMRARDLIGTFWAAVRDGIKQLKEGDEITFNAKSAVVVRHDDVNLTVKQDNRDIPLVIDKLVPGLAVQMAERVLPIDEASTKLVVGMFLIMDQGGDHARGKQLFDEAATAGLDVNSLRPIADAK